MNFGLPPLENSNKKKRLSLTNLIPISLKESENEQVSSIDLLNPNDKVLNNKFFKINDKVAARKTLSQSPKKQYGKTISPINLKTIHEKKPEKTNFQSRNSCHDLGFSNFASEGLIKEYITKCEQASLEKKHSLLEERVSIKEENFNKLVGHFYKQKIKKSPSLLKYFQGKNVEVIINSIGNYIFSNPFSPKELNLSSLEHLTHIHSHLDIEKQDFDAFKGLFLINMRENGLPEEEIQRYGLRIERTRHFIERKIKFEEVSCRKEDFEKFLMRIHENIMKNAMLVHLFEKSSRESCIAKYKKLFNYLCAGYDHFEFIGHKKLLVEYLFENQEINWLQCFELKNIIRNELTDLKSLNFHEDFKLFDHQLHQLHKFILPEPNPYVFECSFDLKMLINLFSNNINREKGLQNLFGKWPLDRIQSHCKYILEYLIDSNHNPYKSCDLASTHSGCLISKMDFDNVMDCFSSSLLKMNIKKSEIDKLTLNFERCQHFISRESHLKRKISGVSESEWIDNFIENIYVYMFANSETKHFYKNSELSYVKYKQKLFFLKLIKNKLDSKDLIDLQAVHSKMGIKPSHFQLFLKFAQESLEEIHMNPTITEYILKKIHGVMDYICFGEK